MDRRGRPSAVMIALILVASCGGPVSPATPSATASGTAGPASPPATVAPSQNVSPSSGTSVPPSPSIVALDPSTARWTRIDTVGAAPGGELNGFDGGYVALGSRALQEPVAWFSQDGRRWTVTSLANHVPNCAGQGPAGNEKVPDADATAIATNGRQVVIVGAQNPHDAAGCADVSRSIQPIAWISDDGRTWRRSAPFYTGGPNGRATAVWAVPDGWQAVAVDPTRGALSLWRSVDGLQWQSVGDLVDATTQNVDAWAAVAGTIVLSRESTDGVARLLTSHDGRTWTPVDKDAGCERATEIVGPASPGLDAWDLLSDVRICTSVDLIHWSAQTLPMAPWRIAQTRFGAIAIGDTCYGAGSKCPDPGPRAYVTADGVTWSRLPHPKVYYGRSLADGPAGVILIGSGPDGGGLAPSVWLLQP